MAALEENGRRAASDGVGPGRLRATPVSALYAVAAIAAVAIAAATVLLVWDGYRHEVAHTEREIGALDHILAEQTARAVQSADLVLSAARERLLRDRAAGYMMDERALHTLLRARIDGVPQVRALAIFDEDGRLQASSRAVPGPAEADGGSLRAAREEGDDVLHVGHVQTSPLDGSRLLPVSRPLQGEGGAAGGLVTAAIDPGYFVALYNALGLGAGRSVTLFLRDGSPVASTADGADGPGASDTHAALFAAFGNRFPAGAGTHRLATDGHLIAYEEVRGYPFVAAVAVTRRAALAEWRAASLRMAAGAAGMIALLGALTALLARQMRRAQALGNALAKSEARLNGIIESALDAILTIDGDRRIVLFNRAAEAMFRCPAAEALGTPVDRFLSARMPARHRRQLAAALTAGPERPGRPVEVTGSRADGDEFLAEVSVSCFEGPHDGLVTGFVRDITRRKRAEEALRKFSRAIDQTASTVVITDPRGVIEYVNPRFVETTGYSAEEALGKRPSLLKSGEVRPGQYETLWSTIVAGGVWHGEFHNRRKDGTLYWESAIVSPIRDEEGEITHYVAIKDDITERKRAEEALRESHRQLREMAATLHSLREDEMARVSRELHDELGQKLTGLKMDLCWLEGRLAAEQAPLRDKVAGMKGLLDSTVGSVRRISTGLRPLLLDDLGPIAALEWLADDFGKRTGIAVDCAIGVDELEADERTATAIFRIVQESLTNVARHAQASAVRISVEPSAGGVDLEVADNGRGIAADGAAKPSGFGLVGIRERAFLCGGEFRLFSRPGEGTTVSVHIPLDGHEAGR